MTAWPDDDPALRAAAQILDDLGYLPRTLLALYFSAPRADLPRAMVTHDMVVRVIDVLPDPSGPGAAPETERLVTVAVDAITTRAAQPGQWPGRIIEACADLLGRWAHDITALLEAPERLDLDAIAATLHACRLVLITYIEAAQHPDAVHVETGP